MGVAKVNGLIPLLRKSDYPGYEDAGINSITRANDRMKDQYISKYGVARFVPQTILDVFDARKTIGTSIVYDKAVTPVELGEQVAD